MDHLVYFTSRKLSQTKHNYTTTKWEGLAMIHSLQKFLQYLLGGNLKFFIDHSTLKYLVNNLVLEGCIYHWLLLPFQNFSFEVIVKPWKHDY